ncbi:MerR family transcriptional regulator [Limnobacter sp.]|uniref:MerR family transcriptional regulator n=1 Tax=Limnobacter sp. TaxID=2003368 RepID=UPI002FE28D70
MKIGELAKRSGLTPATIRFYESKGLITAVDRKANGYREYPAEALAVLSIISNAQQTGFTLDEIKQVMPGNLSQWKHDELISALTKKIADIESMQLRLAKSKSQLKKLIVMIESKPDGLACDDNALRVMQSMGIAGAVQRISLGQFKA